MKRKYNDNNKNYNIYDIVKKFLKNYKLVLILYFFLMMAFPLELVVQPHFYGKILDTISKVKKKYGDY